MEAIKGTRIKACTECRQQKLRCDASKDYSKPCSRCKRFGLSCFVSTTFRREKRRTKSELQAELDLLRKKVQVDTPGQSVGIRLDEDQTTLGDAAGQALCPPPTDPVSVSPIPTGSRVPGLQQIRPAPPITDTSRFCSAGSTAVQYPNTQPQNLDDLNVDAQDIDECFELFFDKYLPYLPIYEKRLRPNECHSTSRFLFWTIVTIGARKYSKDPTLILLLAPKVMELAKTAIFSPDKILATIQALILLCTWQMPIDTLQKDTTSTLAGAMIQLATNIGLHVYGTVQDFSRIPLKYDRQHRDFRTKLWALCLLTCQRVNNCRGLPPVVLVDTYSHEGYKEDPLAALPPSIIFQRTLNQLHSEAILEIERVALCQPLEVRNVALGPAINNALLKLAPLAVDCPSKLDRFNLLSSRAQISTCRLITPSSYIDGADLITLYNDACALIELATELDEENHFTEYGPSTTQSLLTHAALTVFRIGRSHIRGSLDQKRGRKCYFTAIHLNRKHSVRSDDIAARATIILSQLWTSKMVIKQPDGTPDSLWLRCRNRLGLSVSFDSFWLWRQEFGGHPNPYEGVEDELANSTGNSVSAFSPGIDSTNLMMGIGWSPETLFQDFQWPLSDGFSSNDWRMPEPDV